MLACLPGKTIVDGTLGGSGHARRICDQIRPWGRISSVSIRTGTRLIRPAGSFLPAIPGSISFTAISWTFHQFLSQLGIDTVDGILIDIGLSLHQIEASGRGFSFSRDEPLDMRMDVRSGRTAADLLATLDQREMAQDIQSIRRRTVGGADRPSSGGPPQDASGDPTAVNWPGWCRKRCPPPRRESRRSTRPPGCSWPCASP